MAREHYFGGREHAAIKHFFLKNYLETLAFKTLQFQRPENAVFSYVDGFTGPWGSKDEKYEDTSFGVAIDTLKNVKSRLISKLPNVRMRCVFCETRKRAYKDLVEFCQSVSEIETMCVNGHFEENVNKINDFVGAEGFLFAFIDPKGWKVDVSAITPLLRDRWSEVLFNFMSEFAGRFPDFDGVAESYGVLLGDADWRSQYEALPENLSNDEKLLILLRRVLKERWGFKYVLELPISKRARDRVFYKLVYGTRSPHGVIVFRDAQSKAEKEGHAVAYESEGLHRGFFSTDEHLALMAVTGVGSKENIALLPDAIRAQLTHSSSQKYVDFCASILEKVPVQKNDLSRTLVQLKKVGVVDFTAPSQKDMPTTNSLVKMIQEKGLK